MKNIIIITLICVLVSMAACGKKSESAKNMQQIQKEQGIPIRVKTVELETFNQDLSYNAPLSGKEESTAQAMVGDIVTSILVRVGDRVSAGQLVMTFPRSTPMAQYEQASTAFNSAKQTYDRMKNLQAQGAISQQDLDNMETGYKVAKANMDASEKMINIRAPISGVVTNIMVNPSEKTYPGQDLFTVSSTDGFKARLMIPDTDIKKIKIGTPATANWQDIVLNGKVNRIALALDPQTKAVPVDVVFSGNNKQISFGSTVQIKLNVLSKKDVIVVEREYITLENDKKFVWVNENQHAIRREVTTGLDNQLQYEVVSGLNEGDVLIVEGINLLSDKALVKVIE